MIKFKSTVRIQVYSPELRHILETLDNLNREQIFNYPADWTVTSINDSIHSKNSKHYKNQALDLRSHNFNDIATKMQFVELLKLKLENKYTVLFEGGETSNEHFHIQLRKGL